MTSSIWAPFTVVILSSAVAVAAPGGTFLQSRAAPIVQRNCRSLETKSTSLTESSSGLSSKWDSTTSSREMERRFRRFGWSRKKPLSRGHAFVPDGNALLVRLAISTRSSLSLRDVPPSGISSRILMNRERERLQSSDGKQRKPAVGKSSRCGIGVAIAFLLAAVANAVDVIRYLIKGPFPHLRGKVIKSFLYMLVSLGISGFAGYKSWAEKSRPSPSKPGWSIRRLIGGAISACIGITNWLNNREWVKGYTGELRVVRREKNVTLVETLVWMIISAYLLHTAAPDTPVRKKNQSA